MKLFFSVFAAILCAAAVIQGVNLAARRWTAAPRVATVVTPPAPPPRQERTYQTRPRIVLRSLTEIGSLPGAGRVVVSVQDERVDYASDDEAAAAMSDEEKLTTYLVRVAVENGAGKTLDLKPAGVAELLAGLERLPAPFVAHSDYATASFRFGDRLKVSVIRAAKKNHLEIALDDVSFTAELDQLEVFKTQLKAASSLVENRDKGQRAPLTPTWSPKKNGEADKFPLRPVAPEP